MPVDAANELTPYEQAHAALLKRAERTLKSRKLWMAIAGIVIPTALQLATGAVTWPVAVGAVAASVVSYIASQGHVDATVSAQLGQLARAALATVVR